MSSEDKFWLKLVRI